MKDEPIRRNGVFIGFLPLGYHPDEWMTPEVWFKVREVFHMKGAPLTAEETKAVFDSFVQ